MKHGIKLYDTLLGVLEGLQLREIISLRGKGYENNNNMTGGKMSRVTPKVNTLLNLQVEQQAVRNDAQSHALT